MSARPMPCVICGTDLPPDTVGSTPYNGLPGVVLVGIPVCTCLACGEGYIGIPRMEELDRRLAHLIANREGRLSGAEVRFLRGHMGWSGVDFARHFSTNASTVSRWETGKAKMDLRSELLLRVLATRLEPIADYEAFDAALPVIDKKAASPPLAVEARWEAERNQWQMADQLKLAA